MGNVSAFILLDWKTELREHCLWLQTITHCCFGLVFQTAFRLPQQVSEGPVPASIRPTDVGRKNREAFGHPSGGHIWIKVHLFLSTHNIWSSKSCHSPYVSSLNYVQNLPEKFPIPKRLGTQSLQCQSKSLSLLQDCWTWHGFQDDTLHTASLLAWGEVSQDKGGLGKIAINQEPTSTSSTHGIKPPQSLRTDVALPYPALIQST